VVVGLTSSQTETRSSADRFLARSMSMMESSVLGCSGVNPVANREKPRTEPRRGDAARLERSPATAPCGRWWRQEAPLSRLRERGGRKRRGIDDEGEAFERRGILEKKRLRIFVVRGASWRILRHWQLTSEQRDRSAFCAMNSFSDSDSKVCNFPFPFSFSFAWLFLSENRWDFKVLPRTPHV